MFENKLIDWLQTEESYSYKQFTPSFMSQIHFIPLILHFSNNAYLGEKYILLI